MQYKITHSTPAQEDKVGSMIMKNFEIVLKQEKVNQPFGTVVEIYGILKFEGMFFLVKGEDRVNSWLDCPECDNPYEMIAQVKVVRPAVLAGDIREVQHDIDSAIVKEAAGMGICGVNDFAGFYTV